MHSSSVIFISYSRRDRVFAIQLHTKLSELGFTLWRDVPDIPAGSDWWAEIQTAIDNCETLVLCMSLTALRSPIVSKEWNYARERGKRIIPVIADNVFDHPDVISGNFTIPNWMRRANWMDFRKEQPEAALIWNRFVLTLKLPYSPRRAIVTRKQNELPRNYVPRPEKLESVIRALVDDSDPMADSVAIWGAGGYGKTTLAKAITGDLRISGAFDEGVFWVTLGSDLLQMSGQDREQVLLNKVLDLIAEITRNRPSFATLEAASEELAVVVHDRHLLLVLDDVWHKSHIAPFMIRNNCHGTLLTTRSFEAMPDGATVVNVEAMTRIEAIEVLASGLADSVKTNQQEFERLAKRLCYYPLLLGIVNGVIRKQVSTLDRTISEAITHVKLRLDNYGMTAFDERNPQQRTEAVAKTFDVSIELLLDHSEQTLYKQLAIFPEDTLVPLSVVSSLWKLDFLVVEELCERLYDASLLQVYDGLHLGIHDVVRQYLAGRAEQLSDLHKRIIENWPDPFNLSNLYLWKFYFFHLQSSDSISTLVNLILNFEWLQRKLELTDVGALLQDFKEASKACTKLDSTESEALLFLQDAIRLSSHILTGDPKQLGPQLIGRLLVAGQTNLCVKQFLSTIDLPFPWIRPLTANLPQSGTALVRTLVNEYSSIRALAVIPNEDLIVTGDDSGKVVIWNPLNGDKVANLFFQDEGITCLAVSNNGQQICIGTKKCYEPNSEDDVRRAHMEEYPIYIWDLITNSVRRVKSRNLSEVNTISFYKGSQYLIAGSGSIHTEFKDNCIRVYDTSTDDEVACLGDHAEPIYTIQVVEDQNLLYAGCGTGEIFCYELENIFNTTPKILTHDSILEDMLFMKRNNSLYSVSFDGTVQISVDGRVSLRRRIDESYLESHTLAQLSNLDIIILGIGFDFITLNSEDLSPIKKHKAHSAVITGIKTLEHSDTVLTASIDGTIKVWDINRVSFEPNIDSSHGSYIHKIAVSPNSQYFASGSAFPSIKVWDGNTFEHRFVLEEGEDHETVGLCFLDDIRLISASTDCTIKIWDIDSKEILSATKAHNDMIHAFDFNRISGFGASSANGSIKIWKLQPNNQLELVKEFRDSSFKMAFSNKGDTIAWVSNKQNVNSIKLWKIGSTKRPVKLPLNGSLVAENLAFSQDDTRLIVGHFGSFTSIDVQQKHSSLSFHIHNDWTPALALMKNSEVAVSASNDHSVVVWHETSGEVITKYTYDLPIWALNILPDDRIIIAGTSTGELAAFRLETPFKNII